MIDSDAADFLDKSTTKFHPIQANLICISFEVSIWGVGNIDKRFI